MFGKFITIEEFIDSYIKASVQEQMKYVHTLPVDSQAAYLNAVTFGDLVEVKATILKRMPDDTKFPKHYQMNITLNNVLAFTPDVKDDVMACLSKKLPVFLAIRYGDPQGLVEPVTQGMLNGDALHLKGQWITRQKAYDHGGEKTSVMHFTHHPIGFTCTVQKCYS